LIEELLTQKLKDRQTLRFEVWNNSKSIEITQERASFDQRIHNLEKSLDEKRRFENEKEFSTKKKIMKVFENTFKQQVEQYLKFGTIPKNEKEENPTEEKVEDVNINETLKQEEQNEFENFLGDEDENSSESSDPVEDNNVNKLESMQNTENKDVSVDNNNENQSENINNENKQEIN
jgi:hypothetical protein